MPSVEHPHSSHQLVDTCLGFAQLVVSVQDVSRDRSGRCVHSLDAFKGETVVKETLP